MDVRTFQTSPTTPSPGRPRRIHTPPAPLHGGSADNYEPYSPRKSTRIQNRTSNRNRTPSPHFSARHRPDYHEANANPFGSPKSKKSARTTSANMASPASPQKKRAPPAHVGRGAFGGLNAEATTSATAATRKAKDEQHLHPGRASISAVGGMLITPAKTPQKPPSQKTRDDIQRVARSLFNESEVMPSPKKNRPAQSILDSFSADDNIDEPIAIYTDSQDRVPEIDESAANPFYGQQPINGLRRSKRQMVQIPGEGMVSVEDAVRRDDGMVIVFRGKKVFVKHEDSESSSTESSPARLTRSSIKPRLLFARKSEEPEVDEEEVATEIEDNVIMLDAENDPTTPLNLAEQAPGTPKAPKFAPASPPTTVRTTRFGRKSRETTPVKTTALEAPKEAAARGSKRSPFDGWRRVKGSSESGQKRGGDALASPAKRSRA
ncbi:hypothetical protein QBC34DRAFT_177186 [Podospora aff. communis PSN243]|uniref:Uncharacterized protein n=1 Tax=Podospora aff. communis PSN243 TaxID=3040156 RepID=A0AAV9H008_9PEZI|nr:hypothetical protein QBC34DRAFT_177186 [Podospora aff. communis PSN243]